MKHIVALSGGKDSSAMALRLRELYPDREFIYVCTPTGNELPDMVAHWDRLQCLLETPLTIVTGGRSLQSLIREQNCLPNHRMRWCTRLIKIEPFQAFLLKNLPAVTYVGIRADEVMDRDGVDHGDIEGITNCFPMVDWGWGIADVIAYLEERQVKVPVRTDCAMCYHQRLGEWWRLWRDWPKQYKEAEGLEALVGHTLRSEQRDTWPAALKDLRKRFEAGDVPKGADQKTFDMSFEARPTMCSVCAR